MERRKWTKDEVEQWRKEHRRVGYFNKQDSAQGRGILVLLLLRVAQNS
jgi:hypothetical protein